MHVFATMCVCVPMCIIKAKRETLLLQTLDSDCDKYSDADEGRKFTLLSILMGTFCEFLFGFFKALLKWNFNVGADMKVLTAEAFLIIGLERPQGVLTLRSASAREKGENYF